MVDIAHGLELSDFPLEAQSKGQRDAIGADWKLLIGDYVSLIGDESSADSRYLRSEGLQKNMLAAIQCVKGKRVIDVGCGDGWLFDAISPHDGMECDLVDKRLRKRPDFSIQDVSSLTFDRAEFDIVIASLLLMWVKRLDVATRELFRVARPSSRLIVSLVSPHFYRTGHVDSSDNFVVEADLSTQCSFQVFIADEVGPFNYYYRPLADYLNALINAGWHIGAVRDWHIDMDHYSRHVPASLLAD